MQSPRLVSGLKFGMFCLTDCFYLESLSDKVVLHWSNFGLILEIKRIYITWNWICTAKLSYVRVLYMKLVVLWGFGFVKPLFNLWNLNHDPFCVLAVHGHESFRFRIIFSVSSFKCHGLIWKSEKFQNYFLSQWEFYNTKANC